MPKSKSVSKEAAKKSSRAATAPTYDEIAQRAYHIYLERGATPGDPMQDWLQAERELSEAVASVPKKTARRSKKLVSIAA
jgi:hypothetical protein